MEKEKMKSLIDPSFLLGIAHRGLFGKGIPENSRKAFQHAIDNCLAFELDVHLTKDGKTVVSHDSDLFRTTGKKGSIEKLTLEGIRKDYSLSDGESLPTLGEALSLWNDQNGIVLELKPKHNAACLSKAVLEEISGYDKKKVLIISFSPLALLPFQKKYRTLLLVGKEHPSFFFFRFLFDGLDLGKSFSSDKKTIRYSRNHFVSYWTVKNEEEMKKLLPTCTTLTFQDMDHKIVKEALREKNKLL
ncbi:MAG: glycerophosphodiester phosphodiesterase family protein [Bacilli bacterium]|jgi:glycerophosphoryl diester phosphodiesterase